MGRNGIFGFGAEEVLMSDIPEEPVRDVACQRDDGGAAREEDDATVAIRRGSRNVFVADGQDQETAQDEGDETDKLEGGCGEYGVGVVALHALGDAA